MDVIYRVVGVGTGRLVTLSEGDGVSVLGPVGNAFPVRPDKSHAWLVAGGVGLPPMLWLAESLHRASKGTTLFYGAQTADLIALTLDPGDAPAANAAAGVMCALELRPHHTPVVLSTDDGSLGYRGHVGVAMEAFHAANAIPPDDVVVYTCGPERMMRFVAEYCLARGIECYVCMERAMACGIGTCQSCVAAVRDDTDADGWSYRLCCTDGPVFDARDVLWDEPARKQSTVARSTR